MAQLTDFLADCTAFYLWRTNVELWYLDGGDWEPLRGSCINENYVAAYWELVRPGSSGTLQIDDWAGRPIMLRVEAGSDEFADTHLICMGDTAGKNMSPLRRLQLRPAPIFCN